MLVDNEHNYCENCNEPTTRESNLLNSEGHKALSCSERCDEQLQIAWDVDEYLEETK